MATTPDLHGLIATWRKRAATLDARYAPLYGDGYPQTDFALEAQSDRAHANELAAALAAGSRPQPDLDLWCVNEIARSIVAAPDWKHLTMFQQEQRITRVVIEAIQQHQRVAGSRPPAEPSKTDPAVPSAHGELVGVCSMCEGVGFYEVQGVDCDYRETCRSCHGCGRVFRVTAKDMEAALLAQEQATREAEAAEAECRRGAIELADLWISRYHEERAARRVMERERQGWESQCSQMAHEQRELVQGLWTLVDDLRAKAEQNAHGVADTGFWAGLARGQRAAATAIVERLPPLATGEPT